MNITDTQWKHIYRNWHRVNNMEQSLLVDWDRVIEESDIPFTALHVEVTESIPPIWAVLHSN